MVENNELPVSGVVPIDQMAGDDEEDTGLLRAMAFDAETYIQNFSWCKAIREFYFGNGFGGTVAIFLFRIEPARPEVNEWFWVVVGDLPSACLAIDDCKTPSKALERYIAEATKWVELAKHGLSSKRFIQLNKPPTPENAAALESTLKYLSEVLVPIFESTEGERS